MRETFAHEALLAMQPDADLRAPGAAITVELCGSWDHDPPCPLAPHHTVVAEQTSDEVRLRTLFATEFENQDEVRSRIDRALARGQQHGPGGELTRWVLRRSGPAVIASSETERAQRLAHAEQ